MTAVTHPPQSALREYLAKRHTEKTPPPSPSEIRRMLGWGLIQPMDNNRAAECAR